MIKTSLGCVVLIAASIAADQSWAGLIRIDVPEPITVGHTVTWTAVEGGSVPPVSYTWSYRASKANPAPPPPLLLTTWKDMGFGASVISVESLVGSFQVRCVAKYPPMTGLPDSTIIKSVTIQPPDHDIVVAGLDTPAASDYIWVEFLVKNGNVEMGDSVNGYPQERIRRPDIQPPFDSGFTGPTAGEFYSAGRKIMDRKYVNRMHADFVSAPVNGVIDDFYQQNRMFIRDGFGDYQIFYFPEHHFQRVKTGANAWKLIEL